MLLGEVSAAILEVAAAYARKGRRIGIQQDAIGNVFLAHKEDGESWS